MLRIVFSPLVATRFLRSNEEPQSSQSEEAHVGDGAPRAGNCHADIDLIAQVMSERIAHRILAAPRRTEDLLAESFGGSLDELAKPLLETSTWSAEQRAHVRTLFECFHEDVECEWVEAKSCEPPVAAWVLRARGAREAYPLIDLLCVELRKRGVPIVGRLPALGHAEAVARASQCLGRDFSGTRVRVGFVRGHLLELAFAVPGCFGHDDEQAIEAATVYAEAVLGEERLDEWVGSIGVSPAPRGGALRVLDSAGQGSAVTPLVELAGLVERGIEGLLEGLPAEPLEASDGSDWTLLDAEPLRGADGAPSLLAMDDTLMAATRCPELLKCFLEGLPVSSRRFSRAQERFAYLKLPSSLPLAERPAAREEVERALEAHLETSAVVIGNAVGLAHVYVVFALRQLVPALDAFLSCAAHHPQLFPQGSELRFLDATWADEWLPLGA